MQQFFYTLLLCGAATTLAAQPTITAASFPQAGDVFEISTLTDTTSLVTMSQPLAQTWDFTYLYTESYREETVGDAADGANFLDFPNTELLQSITGTFGTAYVDVTNNSMTRVGGGVELFGFGFVAPYADPHVLQTAPLTFNSQRTDNFDIRFGEHIDSIPFLRQLLDAALASSPLPGGVSPDSIRIKVSGSRLMYNEAHGTLVLYDGNYNVLRQKVREETNIFIELRIASPFGGGGFWFDVTGLLTGVVPLPVPTEFTAVYYDYLAEGYRQPIVRQNVDPDNEQQVRSVEFKGQVQPSAAKPLAADHFSAQLAPNPAHQFIRIDLGDENARDITLVISDALGKQLLRRDRLNGRTHELNTDFIQSSGHYPLSFYDRSGKLLGTQILYILR